MSKQHMRKTIKRQAQEVHNLRKKIQRLEDEIRGDTKHMIEFIGGLTEFGARVLGTVVYAENNQLMLSRPALLATAIDHKLVRVEDGKWVITLQPTWGEDDAVDKTKTGGQEASTANGVIIPRAAGTAGGH